LENDARLLAGQNIYDPYSGYGPYGRHNREYTVVELRQLLDHCGYAVEEIFTSDVHPNPAGDYFPVERFESLLAGRPGDLGQYIFVRARRAGSANLQKPRWLYRSYPDAELTG
jgi:hypothetical protein